MLVLNLACAAGHLFEGWFASSDDCESQQRRGLLSCPLCGSQQVERRPSAPRLNVSHLRAEKAGQGAAPAPGSRPPEAPSGPMAAGTSAGPSPHLAGPAPVPMPPSGAVTSEAAAEHALQQLQARYLQVARALARSAEDVGERFAEEARRIRQGDAEDRAIRGQSTPQEVRELLDEGIPLLPLILPEGADGDLH